MKHYLFTLTLFTGIMFMACSSQNRNDGRAVSSHILLAQSADYNLIDSMVAQLDTMITPEIFGRDFAISVVSMTENGTLPHRTELYRRTALLRKVITAQQGEQAFARFAEGVQSFIDGLPVPRRMRVYAQLSTPEQLGTALRIDRFRNPADTANVNECANALRDIYSDDEWLIFTNHFNRK